MVVEKALLLGAIHRIAAQLDNQIELFCGAFSSGAENAISSGKSLYLDEDSKQAGKWRFGLYAQGEMLPRF